MGYILHAMTITGYPSLSDARLGGRWRDARDEADAKLRDFLATLDEDWRRLVVGPVDSITNGYAWLAFLPDGSKEGWEDSNKGDGYRAEFIRLFGEDFTAHWGDEPAHISSEADCDQVG